MSLSTRSILALALATSALAGAASSAHAQSMPGSGTPYVGGSIGVPDWHSGGVNGIPGNDSSGTGLKAYGGYAFNPNFALEAGWARLGRLTGPAGDIKAQGVFVDAVGTLPLTPQWSLLGRVGLFNAKVDTPTGDDRGNSYKVGAGLQYNINKTTSLRGEWERYGLDVFGEKPKADLYTVGVNFAF